MLDEQGVEYRYREYRKEPLSAAEIRTLLARLGVAARDVLRRRDRAFGEIGLTGDEAESVLIDHMAQHPTLLERPIAVHGDRAVVGRPVERILELLET